MIRTTPAPHGATRRYAARGTLALTAAALALTLTTGPLPLASPAAAAVAPGCSGVESDFNGDGIADTAIADPEATANGVAKAGVVHIVYGGGKGTLALTQEAAKAGSSAAGDRFGHALAVYDADLDGCSDLAVGSPYEDIAGQADAGRTVVVYGSPAGLAGGRATTEYIQGTGPVPGAAEAYDWAGYALAAGKSAAGVPFLVIGVPGEDIASGVDAGGFLYISGASTVTVGVVTQDVATAGAVPDTLEAYDRFGSAIAATPTHLAVSSPGEAQGTIPEAGAVTLFSHALTSGVPKPLGVITQDTPNVLGACENGDGFGTSLALVPYRAAGATSTTEALLAVGSPGEDLSTTVDAGAVQVFKLDAAGAYTELNWIDQNTTDVGGTAEAGDYFGQRVAAYNSAPNSTSTASTVRLAVGVPGEDAANGVADRGVVQMFPMIGAPGADKILEPGSEIPTPVAPRLYAGMSIGGGSGGLHVGMPYGPAEGRAVYVFPWTISGDGGAPTQTFKPGQGGLPAEANAFGTVVR
ncbi:VCBS repeat-containing protein [Streptomyces bambusae]|uniref:VCBS repeat-containing protein n=1 Tax=Streptomyces bambusae TaxID=1550616 RepID=A0ABS6Z0X2_9ACTN|nr:VCBS repeat-containing protein [Streptomyces bambusae]MBW5481379.1 VCBS repeat-containing protein [Streptomyces bambusae]